MLLPVPTDTFPPWGLTSHFHFWKAVFLPTDNTMPDKATFFIGSTHFPRKKRPCILLNKCKAFYHFVDFCQKHNLTLANHPLLHSPAQFLFSCNLAPWTELGLLWKVGLRATWNPTLEDFWRSNRLKRWPWRTCWEAALPQVFAVHPEWVQTGTNLEVWGNK